MIIYNFQSNNFVKKSKLSEDKLKMSKGMVICSNEVCLKENFYTLDIRRKSRNVNE